MTPSLESLPEDLWLGFFRPESIHRPQPDLNPRTLDLETTEAGIYNSVRSVSDFFLWKPCGFQLSALAWGDLEPSYACVNFFCLSIASVDGKQNLSEVVFSALVVFSLYTTSTYRRVKKSPEYNTRISSVTYVILWGASDWRFGQQAIDPAHSLHFIQTPVVRQAP